MLHHRWPHLNSAVTLSIIAALFISPLLPNVAEARTDGVVDISITVSTPVDETVEAAATPATAVMAAAQDPCMDIIETAGSACRLAENAAASAETDADRARAERLAGICDQLILEVMLCIF